MVLQKRALQGRTHSASHAMEVHCLTRKLTMSSCEQKLLNLRNPIGNSSTQPKSASVITTVTATTPTHLEVMGPVALENLGNKCTKHNKSNHDVKIYLSPTKATENLDLKNLSQNNTLQKLNINCNIHTARNLLKRLTLNCQVHISIV